MGADCSRHDTAFVSPTPLFGPRRIIPHSHLANQNERFSSCDKAADKLIEALGGKEMAKQTVGGTRWWQVRGLDGIPGEWIVVRKDIAAQRKRHKSEKDQNSYFHRAKSTGFFGAANEQDEKQQEPHEYTPEMEGTPCMLYVHVSVAWYFVRSLLINLTCHIPRVEGVILAL